MKPWLRYAMAFWGLIVGGLILTQLIVGRALLTGGPVHLKKIHEHTGYLTVALALLYVVASVVIILWLPSAARSQESGSS